MNITATLNEITGAPRVHAAFLNSLSYLEYRGFRKIARSRSTEQMTYEVLMHTAEEVRHALFFKRQAVRLGGAEFNTFAEINMVARDALKSYFYQIDERVARLAAKDGKLRDAIYYLVTWLVETRATAVYEIYDQILSRGSFGFSLNGILREEEMHLQELGQTALKVLRAQGFDPDRVLEIEAEEFQKLWSAIEVAVANRRAEAFA